MSNGLERRRFTRAAAVRKRYSGCLHTRERRYYTLASSTTTDADSPHTPGPTDVVADAAGEAASDLAEFDQVSSTITKACASASLSGPSADCAHARMGVPWIPWVMTCCRYKSARMTGQARAKRGAR